MGSSSRVDGVEDSPEVFGCHLVVVFYKSEKGEAEEGVSEDPEVVEEDGEHEVEEADEVVLGGGFWQIGMFLDAVAGFDAPAFSVEVEESFGEGDIVFIVLFVGGERAFEGLPVFFCFLNDYHCECGVCQGKIGDDGGCGCDVQEVFHGGDLGAGHEVCEVVVLEEFDGV